MAQDRSPQPQDDRAWLLQPPGAEEIKLHIEVGDDVEVTPGFRAALEALLSELGQDEVSGFGQPCPVLYDCESYYCFGYGKCTWLYSHPCAQNMGCIVAPTVTRR